MNNSFSYKEAFSRNIGWYTEQEQEALRTKRVAIAGLGGVGGSHLITLARSGIGRFTISDLDVFELANFNRQYGATLSALNKDKTQVMRQACLDINPEAQINVFDQGVTATNLDEFLRDVELYVDSLDFFALEIRRKVFARCYELGIPAITAAPMGMGTAVLIFLPGRMSFEDYFCFNDTDNFEDLMVKFMIGVSPAMQQRHYVVEESAVDFERKKGPSTAMAIDLAAGIACTNAVKLLLGRGPIIHAPHGLHFDAYRNKLVKTWRPMGNRNPIQRLMFVSVKKMLERYRR
ncbi:MAG: ThiF family adenylyltransferase [Gammaproteobacteria bacterium]|nr:ThiF family adenylyltransferase [Pseudomonadales bacterium]